MGGRRGIAAALAAGLVLALSAEAGAQGRKPVVRLSYTTGVADVTSIVAIEQGFFDAEGLIVNAFPESSGGVALQSLVGGSTDFAIGSNVRPLQALARKLPIKVIALNSYGIYSQILVPRSDTSTKSIAELKGKRIGVQVGSGTHTMFVRYLESRGLSENDFRIVNMDTETIPAAFESGSIDAGVPWHPFAAILVHKGLARVLVTEPELADPAKSPYSFYVMTSERAIKDKPDVVRRFARAWVKALAWIHSNRDAAVEVLREATAREGIELPADVIKAALANTRYDRAVISDVDIEDTMASARFLHSRGKLKEVPDFRAAVDNSFVQAAGGK